MASKMANGLLTGRLSQNIQPTTPLLQRPSQDSLGISIYSHNILEQCLVTRRLLLWSHLWVLHIRDGGVCTP